MGENARVEKALIYEYVGSKEGSYIELNADDLQLLVQIDKKNIK